PCTKPCIINQAVSQLFFIISIITFFFSIASDALNLATQNCINLMQVVKLTVKIDLISERIRGIVLRYIVINRSPGELTNKITPVNDGELINKISGVICFFVKILVIVIIISLIHKLSIK